MLDICRLCLSTSCVDTSIEHDMLVKIISCLPVKPSTTDPLPNKICNVCVQKIQDINQYFNIVISADNKLQAMLAAGPDALNSFYEEISKEETDKCDESYDEYDSDDNIIIINLETNSNIEEWKTSNKQLEGEGHNAKDTVANTSDNNKFEIDSNPEIKRERKELSPTKYPLEEGGLAMLENQLSEENSEQMENADEADSDTDPPTTVVNRDEHSTEESLEESDDDSWECPDRDGPNGDIHRQQSDTESEGEGGAGASGVTFHCTYGNCHFSSRRTRDLMTHYDTHYTKYKYTCEICDEGFNIQSLYAEHQNLHTGAKPFVCHCGAAFVFARYLREHKRSVHPRVKLIKGAIYRCETCGKDFKYLTSLRRHRRVHTGQRNYLCYICGKALTSAQLLTNHIRSHTGVKPHVCTTCGKGFVKKWLMEQHNRVHTGERPYVCPHCGKTFAQQSSLVVHRRYHSSDRPYICSLCNEGFVSKSLLSMHAKKTCI